jgi:hypothetical protein
VSSVVDIPLDGRAGTVHITEGSVGGLVKEIGERLVGSGSGSEVDDTALSSGAWVRLVLLDLLESVVVSMGGLLVHDLSVDVTLGVGVDDLIEGLSRWSDYNHIAEVSSIGSDVLSTVALSEITVISAET